MPIVRAPPRLMALATLRAPARIGAPNATTSQGIHDGISSHCFRSVLIFEALIARIVANQPTNATKIAPATMGDNIKSAPSKVLPHCNRSVYLMRAYDPSQMVLSVLGHGSYPIEDRR